MDEEKVVHRLDTHDNLAAALNGVFDSQISGGKRYDLAILGRRRANATFFESHAVDSCENIAFAMDLTPLVADETLDILEYVTERIRHFEADVRKKSLHIWGKIMEVIITPDSVTASRKAAQLVGTLIRRKPDAVLGLATGSTPIPLYQELARMHREENLDFSHCTSFNLDEYVGLSADHPASYRRFMQENLFSHINLPSESIHIPDGLAQDIPAHCAAYERAITQAGGIDVQVLGIGSDGHVGFNEPSSSLASRTRIKTLTHRTRCDNAPLL